MGLPASPKTAYRLPGRAVTAERWKSGAFGTGSRYDTSPLEG